MATIQAAMSGVQLPLISAVTTGTGTAISIPSSFRNHNFLCQTASGVSAGTISIETGSDPTLDTGTWAVLTTFTTSAGSTDQLFQYTGILNNVRARVTTAISGGGAPSASVFYTGAKSY